MYNEKDLSCIDSRYFRIIMTNEYDVSVMSLNTGHYWLLHGTEDESVIVFHKHVTNSPYHFHGKTATLRQAISNIKSHDKWQINGRK